MTGYLQRLASSAIKPGGSVRPVAGTVFSASRFRAAHEPGFAEPDVLSAGPGAWDADRGTASRPRAGAPHPPPGAPRGPQEGSAGTRPSPWAPPEAAAARAAAKPEQGRPPAQARLGSDRDSAATSAAARFPEPEPRARRALGRGEAGPAERAAARPRDGAQPPASSDDAGTEAAQAHGPRAGRGPMEAVTQRPFVPVVAGDFGPPAVSGGGPAGPAAPARRVAGSDHGREGRAPAAPRGPDEINIHIGRIEVTAAPPPPLRPAAPKAHRKAPSLDEYLRRRSGRIP